MAYLCNFCFYENCAFHNHGFLQVKQGMEFRGVAESFLRGAREGPVVLEQDVSGRT